MLVRITYRTPGISIIDTFSGSGSEEVVAAMKSRVAAESGFAVRLLLNSMSPLAFAQEVVRRYNKQSGKNLREPRSCGDFIAMGVAERIAEVVEE